MTSDEMLQAISQNDETGLEFAFAKATLFQSTELLAYQLDLLHEPDTRLQTFLDLVYEFSQGKDGTLSGFVEHWNVKSEGLSVPYIL